jgi:hypothetical protein
MRRRLFSPTMTTPGDPLSRALAEALGGRPQALHALLARGSRLPGPRINEDLADAFAQACRSLGARADAVALALARLSPDEAPGATTLEFLPVCGLYALAARAAADPKARPGGLEELHAHADDVRFRVRDAVVLGLARVGAATGDALVGDVVSWMDGYFHAAAVLLALSNDVWLTTLHDAGPVVERMDEAFVLLRDAPRSVARYPGHKALVAAMGRVPGLVASRFGVPVFDMLVRWAQTKDPTLREIVEASLGSRNLAGRYGPELERVRAALIGSRAPARNPDHDFGPSRDRSKDRRKNKR